MVNLNIKDGVDGLSSVNNFIPTGSLIPKSGSPSILTKYDTDDKCIKEGFVPCDGRILSPYVFKNLHSVISNIYGGNEYKSNFAEIERTVTSFTSRSDLMLNRYVKLFLDNSDGAITIKDNIAIPGFYEGTLNPLYGTYGAQLTEVSSTFVEFWDKNLVFFSPNLPIKISRVLGFRVPDLRTSRRYIYGQASASSGIYTPAMNNSFSDSVSHYHSVSTNGTSLLTNNTAETHTHSTSYSFNSGGSDNHNHTFNASLPGLSASNAVGTTLTKADGTGTAAGAAHGHTTGAFNASAGGGNGGLGHAHSGSGTSSSYSQPTHSHNVSSVALSTPNSSSVAIPYVNMIYFIKI